MKNGYFVLLLLFFGNGIFAQNSSDYSHFIQIVFTSDAHYGITRKKFRGDSNVEAHVVNRAMIQKINNLPGTSFPNDKGVDPGKKIRAIDYVIEGGDIANRMEIHDQSDAASWKQFCSDYINGITLTDHHGKRTKIFIIPGNHDITNAIGFYRPMKPKIDPTSMVAIYNLMMNPAQQLTTGTYNYSKDKINYSKNIGGIHFMFITLWPDSSERIWMTKDLQSVSPKTPVILFTHDQPESEAKHFTNPDKARGINANDRFEDLVDEVYKDGTTAAGDGGKTYIEQRDWVSFLKRHPNIKAYFHGNENFNEYYVYKGPDSTVALNTFRVDSPMKGDYSSTDQTKLSFQVITIDTKSLTMTVRECLWNTDPSNPEKNIQWGASKTVMLN
ncbi:MAG TPA: metallophosphoesterase [Ginsengibacter sp.]